MSSDMEYQVYRRRREMSHNIRQRHVVYRVGDIVEMKCYSIRSRRARWIPAEVYEVWRDEIYGDLTYSVWLSNSEKTENFVRPEELRFREPLDLEQRWREDEIVRADEFARQENIRQLELERVRQQREIGHRGRGRVVKRSALRPHDRARSADEDVYTTERANLSNRAVSVPPGDWQDFVSEFAKFARRGDRAHQGFQKEYNDEIEFNDNTPHQGGDVNEVNALHYGEDEIDDHVRKDWLRRSVQDPEDFDDVNVGGGKMAGSKYPAHQDSFPSDSQRVYEMNFNDQVRKRRSGINLNIILPPGDGIRQGRDYYDD